MNVVVVAGAERKSILRGMASYIGGNYSLSFAWNLAFLKSLEPHSESAAGRNA